MKRDLDVIRRILLELEAADKPRVSWAPPLEGVPDEVALYHAQLAVEAGLVKGHVTEFHGDVAPYVGVSGLTWAGHDFLDAAREPGRWERVKAMAAAAGGVTFDVLKAWLVEAIPNPFRGA